MKKRRLKLYWASQVVGWGAYVLLIALFNSINGVQFDAVLYLNLLSTFLLGIGTSHLYRYVILKYDLLKMRIAKLIPLVILASIILSAIYYVFHTFISEVLIMGRPFVFEGLDFLQSMINLSALYLLWTLIYWSFHFIENYRKEEIKNLRWQATIKEMELNKIKSQLNPHFIFNSMNNIRGTINENPVKAQNLITQLSNILRSSLYMEKKPLIPFDEELSLVKDYLDLEKARLEERLDYNIDVSPESSSFDVPPLLFQTLVENGIKHGVATLAGGGKLIFKTFVQDDILKVEIVNTGSLKPAQGDRKGIGLDISRQRLKLLYGQAGQLEISEKEGNVVARLDIPKESIKIQHDESIDH
jgi:two-component system LytT family sensor kinase